MPAKTKHTPETRKRICDLYQEGRKGKYHKGRYTYADIEQITILIKPTKEITAVKRDSSDNRILECALEAKADYIVSGDIKHLQSLKNFQGIPILSPAKFLSAISM